MLNKEFLMPQNSENELPEVFSSKGIDKDRIYYLQDKGKIRKIAPLLYTTNMADDVATIVSRNLWQVVELLYPGAIISERTAVEMTIADDKSLFIISDKTPNTTVGGVTIKPKKGAAPQSADLPFMEHLFLASPARVVLENAAPSRVRGGVSRRLSRAELEEYLDRLIRNNGEAALNKLRDEMRDLAPHIGLRAEFEMVNNLISTLLQTHDDKMKSTAGQARSRGFPFDPRRVELFARFHAELEKTAPIIRQGKSSDILAFFEAYFSNFIEGTEFEVEEAHNIVFNNIIPQNRPADAHDIRGTFAIVSNTTEMTKTPAHFDEFLSLLKSRHTVLMEGRPDKEPGIFKTKPNRAGSTFFIAPDLVVGTFRQGFEIYRRLTTPFSRAAFMMFLVSEVHPFNDGNGRIGRIMMNAELVSAGEQRVIVPIVYRDNYITALKALSHNSLTTPIIRTLDFAQKYTSAINWDTFKTAFDTLTQTHAFTDSTDADREGIRLILPREIVG
jgi:hypothetical protein